MRSHAKAVVATSVLLLSLALGVTIAGAVAPSVTINAASSVSYTSAHLSGTVDPKDQETYAYFQFSKDPEAEGWSQSATLGPFSAGAGVQNVSDDLSSLQPGSNYFVRLVAESVDGQTISVEPNPSFTTEAVALPSVSIDPVTAITDTSAHFAGTINPNAPGGNPAAFDLTWRFQCNPDCPGLTGGQIPADASNHAVSVDASGLEPNTAYEVSLVAENAGGALPSGPRSFKTSQAAPRVQTLYAGSVGTDAVTLAAKVNPENSPTTYQLEWGPDNSYGNVTPASPSLLSAEDGAFHLVTAPISDLDPGTSYHFRVVATNSDTAESAVGVDHAFTTLTPAPGFNVNSLPDERVWEKVSPGEKGGADIDSGSLYGGGSATVAHLAQASASGNAVTFGAAGAFGGALTGAAAPAFGQYLSKRSPSGGWITEGINPPLEPTGALEGSTDNYQWFSDDLSLGAVITFGPVNPGEPPGVRNLFMRNQSTGSYERLSNADQSSPPYSFFQASGASADGTHIVFERRSASSFEPLELLEWTNGELHRVDILPPGEPTCSAGAGIGNGELQGALKSPGGHPISDDGSRTFFSCKSDGLLYVREHGTTTAVGVSEKTGDDPTKAVAPAVFQFAKAADGSVAFFKTTARLTDDSSPGGDLYRWNADAPIGSRLTDLTTADAAGGDVLGVAGASEDASSFYFAALGKLTPDAVRGIPNLYHWQEGEGLNLVATLDGPKGDDEIWSESLFGSEAHEDGELPPFRGARVSKDGRYISFASFARLTSYDTNGTKQIYLYDSQSHQLTCVSCGTVEPHSVASSWMLSNIHESTCCDATPYLPRNLSPGGDRMFFDSRDALVPKDTNGVTDVYEWRDGRISLLSSGSNGAPSRLLDASEDGTDVFFTTAQRLVRSDGDDLVDLYDARTNGIAEPAPSVPCVGDECQETPSPPRAFATPGSATFSGNGSGSSRTKCQRGKARRHGRCVKKKKGRANLHVHKGGNGGSK